MCGIFGVIDMDNSFSKEEMFKAYQLLSQLSESRGKEASGISVIQDNNVSVFKLPEISKVLQSSNEFKKYWSSLNANKPISFFGHSRLVTNGYEDDNNNNQPVIKKGWVIVHNGIIVNANDLFEKLKIVPDSELDSEIIPNLLSEYLKKESNDIPGAINHLFSEISGMSSIAMINNQENTLYLSTNNGSIYFAASSQNRQIVFGSEKYIIDTFLKQSKLAIKTDFGLPEQILPLTYKGFDLTINNKNEPLYIEEIEIKGSATRAYRNTSFEIGNKSVKDSFLSEVINRVERIKELKTCTKCLLPETFPFIEYDSKGECNFCNNYKPIQCNGSQELKNYVLSFKEGGKSPDCLLPFSGGRDSSYVLHYVKEELGMNPLCFSYDWGMITDLARRNQSRMCGKLGVEHILVSADIRKKRDNIHKNVSAWLKKPHLGTIPLFMAGDKQYFYYTNLLLKYNDLKLSILGENLLETTNFKSGFCGIKPHFDSDKTYSLSTIDKLKMALFYGKEFLLNPSYINSSMLDTMDAFKSYYVMEHKSINLFDYLEWDESSMMNLLWNEYDWEMATDTNSSWRIGDGTASFYNYIYFMVAGFTENDTFRSNQIREGKLSKQEAKKTVDEENQIRWDSLQWYCNTIKVDFERTIENINKIKPKF